MSRAIKTPRAPAAPRAVVFPATVEPRVRDSLVLRIVTKRKNVLPRNPSDVRRAS